MSRMHPVAFNGERLDADEFAYTTLAGGSGLNPAGIDQIVFFCPSAPGRMCMIGLTLGPQEDTPERRRWHWDGNMEQPSLTPSIGCDRRCGWHGHVTAGKWSPA